MLKLFKHFRGGKIDCPMKLYRAEYIADLAKQTTDRRERAKIARAAGYTVKFIEGVLNKRKTKMRMRAKRKVIIAIPLNYEFTF